jgi:hypothetical protein
MKSIMWQLLVALHTCHHHDITHRDVKPGANTPFAFKDASKGGFSFCLLFCSRMTWLY